MQHVAAFGARCQHRQCYGCRRRSRARHRRTGQQVQHGDQQGSRQHRVRFEHALDVVSSRHRRQEEIRPVVMQSLRCHVRIARRRVVAAQLGGQRGVPHEIGGEIRAIPARARFVLAAEIAIRRTHEHRNQQQGEDECPRVGRRPRRQRHQRLLQLSGQPDEKRSLQQPGQDEREWGRDSQVNGQPQRQLRGAVSQERADDPSSRVCGSCGSTPEHHAG